MDGRIEHRRRSLGSYGCLRCGAEAIEILACNANHDAGLRAELARAQGHRIDESLADLLRALGKCARQQEDRIDAAHLGIDRNWNFARSSHCNQPLTYFARAGKPDCTNRRMLHQRFSHGPAPANKQREDSFGKAKILHHLLNDPADELRSAKMGRVRLCDHRASGREGRRRVSPCDGKGQREVAGAEDHNRANTDLLGAQISPRQRLAFGYRGIDDRIQPPALTCERGKQTELTNRAGALTLDPRSRQAGFRHYALNQHIPQIQNALRNRLQELCALLQRQGAIRIERGLCKRARLVHLALRAFAELRLHLLAGGWVDGADLSVGPAHCTCADQHLARKSFRAGQFRYTHRRLLMPLQPGMAALD